MHVKFGTQSYNTASWGDDGKRANQLSPNSKLLLNLLKPTGYYTIPPGLTF
jgi:hypothetical protein